MSDQKLPDDVLWHQSGVNAQGEPFVQLIQGTAVIAQMSCEQARDGNYIHVYIRLLYTNLASDLALYLTTSV